MRASSVAVAAGALAGLGVGCSNAPRPADWGYLSPAIFQPTCATQSCHSQASAVAGLDFSDPDRGYESLTGLWVWVPNPIDMDLSTLSCGTAAGQKVCEQQLRPLVTPYDPDQSRLVNMLRARGATRMPPDRPLPEADIELVEQWILNGATRHHGGARLDAAVDAARRDGAARDAGARDAGPGDGRPTDGARDGSLQDGKPADGSSRPADGATRS